METILLSLMVHHRKIHWYQMVDLRYAPTMGYYMEMEMEILKDDHWEGQRGQK